MITLLPLGFNLMSPFLNAFASALARLDSTAQLLMMLRIQPA
jgi:hypothetical protein